MNRGTKTRRTGCAYSVIADVGAATREEVVGFLAADDVSVNRWLRRQVQAGYLFRDEFGAYRTSCPWPRAGF